MSGIEASEFKRQFACIEGIAGRAEILASMQPAALSKVVKLLAVLKGAWGLFHTMRNAARAALFNKILGGLLTIRDLADQVAAGELPTDKDDPISGIDELEPELSGAIKFVVDGLAGYARELVSSDAGVREHIRAQLLRVDLMDKEGWEIERQIRDDEVAAKALAAEIEKEDEAADTAAEMETRPEAKAEHVVRVAEVLRMSGTQKIRNHSTIYRAGTTAREAGIPNGSTGQAQDA